MENMNRLYPGDKIRAYGVTAEVFMVLFWDRYADPGEADAEIIDTAGNYRHWKQFYDGGDIIRSGIPGDYYRPADGLDRIAAIRPGKRAGYTVRIIDRDGRERWLGSAASVASAVEMLTRRTGETWEKM